MAFFGVTIEELEWVKPHPNPIVERLEIAKCKDLGFTFCIGKGQHKAGEKVLYIPIDSLVSQEVLKKMGLEGKLSGKEKNRVRTKTLQGYPSQGIIASLDLIKDLENRTSESITNFLGVTKYEPPEVMDPCGRLLPLPEFLSTYDIEGCDRHVDVLEVLKTKNVYVTEKIEGSNFSVSFDILNNRFFVNQRNFTIVEIKVGNILSGRLLENLIFSINSRNLLKNWTQKMMLLSTEKLLVQEFRKISTNLENIKF